MELIVFAKIFSDINDGARVSGRRVPCACGEEFHVSPQGEKRARVLSTELSSAGGGVGRLARDDEAHPRVRIRRGHQLPLRGKRHTGAQGQGHAKARRRLYSQGLGGSRILAEPLQTSASRILHPPRNRRLPWPGKPFQELPRLLKRFEAQRTVR